MQRLGLLRSRFFWKLFLTCTLLFVALTSAIGWAIYSQLHDTLTENVRISLQHKVAILIPYGEQFLSRKYQGDFGKLTRELGERTSTRITYTDEKGKVVADSDFSTDSMDNHASRPEIMDARRSDFGYAERYSRTGNTSFVYLAEAIKDPKGTLLGFVRVSWPRQSLEQELWDLRNNIIIATLIGIAIALVIAFFLAQKVTVPMTEMMRVCDALRRGNYDERVKTLPNDEIGRLGDTLNRLGGELTKKISEISLERAQLKTMLAGMVEGIIAVDNQDNVRFCNRAAYHLLGSNLTDARGMRLSEVQGFDVLVGVLSKARQKRELIEEELSIEADLTSRLLEVHASFFEGIDTTGVIIVLHDITKVRDLEKMRRDFVANVSHELKTPLTSIKGYVETLITNDDIEAETQTRFLHKIERNADRLMRLVQDILSLAQIEAQEGSIPLRPTDLGSLTRQVMSQYDDQVSGKELEVELKEFNKPLIVMGDKEAMFQVLDNLYTNAIRYTPQGGKITISLREKNLDGTVEVQDTGIGIPKKYLARIFERFYRVDKARSRELGGTGLGLSIVKHLVSSMGGSISVESEVGMGSKFAVSLPLAR